MLELKGNRSTMNKLAPFLTNVTIGQPQVCGNMKVYPLHTQNGHQRSYRTLDEAMQAKEIEVKEASEGGSVPTLTVHNTGKLPVLLVTGEELIGAKQNRVLNTSLLVPAESELQIPVSCVEQGRWHYTSGSFASSSSTAHLKLRKEQSEHVTRNLIARASFDADQGAVWGEVARKTSAHQSSSPTRALHDVYDQNENKLKEYLDAFPPVPAEGLLVAIDEQIVGADLFDHHETLQALWPKLIRGYALDALERTSTPQPATPSAPISDTKQFIDLAQSAEDQTFDAVGLGKDVRLNDKDKRITGSGLLWEERLIHANLFDARM